MSMSNVTEEQAKKKYAEAGLARIKPIVPELPTTIEDPTKKTGAAWLSDYVNSLKKPITPEEEARRERAARAVQGVAGLGNVMTAFSNLAFTGKGAPSQTLPTQQADAMGKEITSWQDKLASEREKYAAAMLGAKTQQWKMEQEAQQRAQMQANEDRRFEYQKKKDEQARQDKLDENAQAQEDWNKQYEQSLKQQETVNKQNQQRLDHEKDELKARQDGSYYTGKKTEDWKPVSTHVGDMEIDNSKLNGINLAQYAEMLKENGEDELARALASLSGDEKSLEQLRQTIGKALVNPSNTAIVEDMIKKGILRPAGASSNSEPKGLGWGNGNIDLSSGF